MDRKQQISNTYEAIIKQKKLFAIVIVLVTIASVVFLSAAFIRWKYGRIKELECGFMLAAFLFYLIYESIYLAIVPLIYHLNAIRAGVHKPYPTMPEDIERFIIYMYSASTLFWFLLWSVKFALLVLYRRMMIGLPLQLKFWMAILIFTIITFVFSFIATLTSCGGVGAIKQNLKFFCSRPSDALTRDLSMYGSFACDVITNLLIMILPLRLIWGLQMSLKRKLAVAAMISIGILCIIASIVRVIEITEKTKATTPNSLWLILWGSIEATTAICVGAFPSFRFVRKTSHSTHADYVSSKSAWANSRNFRSIQMQPYDCSNDGRHVATVYGGAQPSPSSQDKLTPEDGVIITTQHQIHIEPAISPQKQHQLGIP
ncbi:hypothetical protein LOZ58_006561 [Ophidiomyces ophidiicola]|nr:hypothetical protein LOZ65_004628 [Ophidiomyces ophidiicola]KAI1933278.1 hypothetical protein LOZ66_006569 [Ophidiomyces ophidiicola]KAI1955953.1 hypothetical protein LOZ58_006561 [Ophidiomyces ophidiicola]